MTKNNILRSWKNVLPTNPLLVNDSVTQWPEEDEFLDSISMVCDLQSNQFDCESLQMKHEDVLKWIMIADLSVEEVMSQDESTDDNCIEEPVPAAQPFTVSCEDAMSAAMTLLCCSEERGVGVEHII